MKINVKLENDCLKYLSEQVEEVRNYIKQLPSLGFEDVFNNWSFCETFNYDETSAFDFNYRDISGTVQCINGKAELSNEFSYYKCGNFLFYFEVDDDKEREDFYKACEIAKRFSKEYKK